MTYKKLNFLLILWLKTYVSPDSCSYCTPLIQKHENHEIAQVEKSEFDWMNGYLAQSRPNKRLNVKRSHQINRDAGNNACEMMCSPARETDEELYHGSIRYEWH